jgi:hypothetical protein
MSIVSGHNPKQTMYSKLTITAMIANIVNIAICAHVALTALDHNPVPFYYFYIISVGLIINGIGVFIAAK